jgi:hypothetical protein
VSDLRLLHTYSDVKESCKDDALITGNLWWMNLGQFRAGLCTLVGSWVIRDNFIIQLAENSRLPTLCNSYYINV